MHPSALRMLSAKQPSATRRHSPVCCRLTPPPAPRGPPLLCSFWNTPACLPGHTLPHHCQLLACLPSQAAAACSAAASHRLAPSPPPPNHPCLCRPSDKPLQVEMDGPERMMEPLIEQVGGREGWLPVRQQMGGGRSWVGRGGVGGRGSASQQTGGGRGGTPDSPAPARPLRTSRQGASCTLLAGTNIPVCHFSMQDFPRALQDPVKRRHGVAEAMAETDRQYAASTAEASMGCGVVPACGVVERVPGFAALLATQTGAVDLHAFLVPCLQPGARHVVCAEAWVPQAYLKPGAGHEERVREVATPLVATTAACPTSPPGGRKPLEKRQAGRGLSAAGARVQGAERRSGKERRKRCLQTYLQVQLWEARAAARTDCIKRARAAARNGQAAGPRKPAPGWQCIKCFASVTIFRDLPAYTATR